jgi:hypothetical protein
MTRTLETRPADATHWSTRSTAQAVGPSQSAVRSLCRGRPLLRGSPLRLSAGPVCWFSDGTIDAVNGLSL